MLGFSPISDAEGASAEPAQDSLALTIRLYDYANPGDAILSRAKSEARQALVRIGIDVHWRDCPLTMDERQTNKSCAVAAGPTDLIVRLLDSGSRPAVSSQTDTFGYALIGDSETPRTASVLFGNVESIAWQRLEDSSFDSVHRSIPHERYLGVLLGYVIAHEIGHLLLATDAHSTRGMMQAHWNPSAIRDMMTGRFGFAPKRARSIRKRLAARSAALGARH